MLKTILVDDEFLSLQMLEHLVRKSPKVQIAGSFTRSLQALEYARAHPVDLAFLDIEMPGMSGIDLAREFLLLPCPPVVVFVTAYPEYSIDAWGVEALDYILKPYREAQVQRAILRASQLSKRDNRDISFRCFPSFALLIGKKPYSFRSKMARELLAYLVHSRQNWVLNNELIYVLFGDTDEEAGKNYFRQLIYRLRKELSQLGLEQILVTDYGRCRVDIGEYSCDYYDFLAGKNQLFLGEYLREYSWAEPTLAALLKKT